MSMIIESQLVDAILSHDKDRVYELLNSGREFLLDICIQVIL